MATTQYGITPAFADLLLASLNGVRTNIDTVCAQLHDGDPGPQGVNNLSAITTRQPLTFTAPDNGAVALSGGVPTWTVAAGETLKAISLWSGTDSSAVCLFTLPLSVATPIAEGDVLILNTCHLEWWDAANKVWPQILTVTAGIAQAQASAPLPTLVASSILPVPTANASASAPVPTVFLGTIVAATTASGSALALVPTVSLDMVISAPVATATVSALVALPATIIPGAVATGNGSALVPTISGTAAIAAPVAHGSSTALAPTVTVISPVTYDATGAGAYGTGTANTLSWSHTINGNAVVMAVNIETNQSTLPTLTAKVGTTAMTRLDSSTYYVTTGGFYIWTLLFGLTSPPTGAQTMSVAAGSATEYWCANSVSYGNCTGFGTVVSAKGTTTQASISVSSATNQMALSVIGGWENNYTSGSQTVRWNEPGQGVGSKPTIIQDAAGAATVTFTASPNQATGWGALAVPLL